ncbi:hypothetical protein BC351_08075 [Paenibacillus ferrarius]|uniref:Uncharacterized protein n=1 Tax=Paenibacillus ferrarius TaxID=1469647 RepID=A0A1V4HCB9_9BACL|nr:hypothetical protein BC351_08075 [Paenibacillus ferrarius]
MLFRIFLRLYIFFVLGLTKMAKFLQLCMLSKHILDSKLIKQKMPAQLQAFPLYTPFWLKMPAQSQVFTSGSLCEPTPCLIETLVC